MSDGPSAGGPTAGEPTAGDRREAAEAMEIARTVAGEAAALLATAAGKVADVRSKSGPRDLVTEWDTRAEDLIRDRLSRLTPGVAIVAEESHVAGDADSAPPLRWVVDPLDGTVNFVHGVPIFAVAIALERDGDPIAGAVYAPALGWEFYGHAGGGSFRDGQPMAVSLVDEPGRAMLATGFPYDRATNPANNFAEWEHFQRRVGACRRFGAASLDLCMVACGWLDGYWESRLNVWDVSAGALFVREAGGAVTNIDGSPFVSSRGALVASNGAIHAFIVDELADLARRRRDGGRAGP